MITQAQLKELLHYNPETGLFTWIQAVNRNIKPGKIAGTIDKDGYRNIMYSGKMYRAHRLAYLYMTGSIPEEVDHDNHIRHDNRWVNLNPSTFKENKKNRSLSKNNSSGFNGVSWAKSRGKWKAQITVNKKIMYLGLFNTIEEAVQVRKAAELKYNFHKNHGVKHVSSNN